MNFTLYDQITYYLLSLGLVGEPGLAVLTTISVVVALVAFFVAGGTGKSEEPEELPPSTPTPGGGGGSDPQKDKWKKIALGVAVGVGTLVVAVALGGWIGWNDPLFAFKQPTTFFTAGVNQLGKVIPGLTLTGGEAQAYLEGIYTEVYRSVSNSGVVFPKIIEAQVLPKNFLVVQTKIEDLGLNPTAAIQSVLSTYPHGATEATLRAALKVALTDQVDTLILEHAEEWF